MTLFFEIFFSESTLSSLEQLLKKPKQTDRKNINFFINKYLLQTVSQKYAVNKRKSVGTIAYMPGLRLWKDLLVDNETIAHAMRYIMPQKKRVQ